MNILISDKVAPIGIEILEKAEGIKVDYKPGMKKEELLEIIGEYEGLIIRSATKVTKEVIDAANKLKYIVRAGEGTDNIDKPYAREKGIDVMNTPGQNSRAVVELAIGHIFSLARFIPKADRTMKNGLWEKKKLQGTEVLGKTLGLFGFGKIGKGVAECAKAIGMNVLVYDPIISKDNINKAGFEFADPEKIYKEADYISLHVPLLDATRNLISSKEFEKMKDGVKIINCSRGGIINENDLVEYIKKGKVGGAGLDVFCSEPPEKDNALLNLDEVVLTPHIGASSAEAQVNVVVQAADQLISINKGDKPVNVVN